MGQDNDTEVVSGRVGTRDMSSVTATRKSNLIRLGGIGLVLLAVIVIVLLTGVT